MYPASSKLVTSSPCARSRAPRSPHAGARARRPCGGPAGTGPRHRLDPASRRHAPSPPNRSRRTASRSPPFACGFAAPAKPDLFHRARCLHQPTHPAIHFHRPVVPPGACEVRFPPSKSPWLNRIEPRWTHGKRKVLAPERLLAAAELHSQSASVATSAVPMSPTHALVRQGPPHGAISHEAMQRSKNVSSVPIAIVRRSHPARPMLCLTALPSYIINI